MTSNPCPVNKIRLFALVLGIWLLANPALEARTRLVTLPHREAVTLQLTGSGPTLVQEKRVLTLDPGVNPVDFSWQNVSIDRSSIILTPLAAPDEARLLSVSYPPGENALVWEVFSSHARELPVVISYLLAGIDHIVTHEVRVHPDETRMDLTSHLVLRNFSGENFDAATLVLERGPAFTTRIRHMETKQLVYARHGALPVNKVHTWDGATQVHVPPQTGPVPGIPTGYSIANTPSAGLGAQPLPQGKARVFHQDPSGTRIFSGEDRLVHLPKGDKTVLNIGESRDIRVTRRPMETRKVNIRKNRDGQVQVYDRIQKVRLTIENFKKTPAVLTLKEHIYGQWEPIKIGHAYELADNHTLVFNIALDPGEKQIIDLDFKELNIFARRFNQFNRAKSE